jgi:hypothetical protein
MIQYSLYRDKVDIELFGINTTFAAAATIAAPEAPPEAPHWCPYLWRAAIAFPQKGNAIAGSLKISQDRIGSREILRGDGKGMGWFSSI